MLLRRITEHAKTQNWFAVALDFLIVVIGVGVAMLAQQWVTDYQQRQEMRLAEDALQNDLISTYYYSKERLALVACRVQTYKTIAKRLLEPEGMWTGMPALESETSIPARLALPRVLRSPSRNWGSRTWHAELARGSFNQMDDLRRSKLDVMFTKARRALILQQDIHELEARLNTLGVSSILSQSERLRYRDILAQADVKSFLLENHSSQIIDLIEAIGISEAGQEESRGFLEDLPEINNGAQAIYGECREPVTLPFLESQAGQ